MSVKIIFLLTKEHKISTYPRNTCPSIVKLEFTKNGVFSVKYAYLLSRISDQDLGENQVWFDKWGKVWGLGLSPKVQLFIWKVLNQILAVKDALLRWIQC